MSVTIGEVKTAVVLFNRDLRVHDHPALTAAARAERTVPLFVLDQVLPSTPDEAHLNR
jgi:deoxyribodipyrimidine photolyase